MSTKMAASAHTACRSSHPSIDDVTGKLLWPHSARGSRELRMNNTALPVYALAGEIEGTRVR